MNLLRISHNGKAIPYGPATNEDGSRNYGFRVLKGEPASVDGVPEAQTDACLRTLLLVLNDVSTGVFTVGCLSHPAIEEAEGFRRAGYIEFALNDTVSIRNAASYFPCFFHFDNLWNREGMNRRARLLWELQAAFFVEPGIDGFTCAITIDTGFYQTQAEADSCWEACLELLTRYLGGLQARRGAESIY